MAREGVVGASAAAPAAAEPARRSIRRSSTSTSVLHSELHFSWLLPRNRHEIDPSGSPNRRIDIASDRIRVRADRMSILDEVVQRSIGPCPPWSPQARRPTRSLLFNLASREPLR